MTDAIIVINAGSTSLKFAAYAANAAGSLPLLCRGQIDSLHTAPRFVVNSPADKPLATHEWGRGHAIDHKTALHYAITWMHTNVADLKVVAAGHRVLLGGTRFDAPVRIDDGVLDYLDSLAEMEPSHQSFNVRGARALGETFPGLAQVACFDTSFHRTMPAVAQTYALPREVRDGGVRHWGYHGISYDYISRQILNFAPQARRVIAAHLGGGASLCAMLDGCSVDTTMGFAGLSGLPMATRSGDVPPGVLFYLLRSKLFDDTSLEKMLYERAGLLGLSGISGDMRVLQESKDAAALAAVDYYIYAMLKYVGAYVAVLGGLDALVFTAGIGEHSAPVRSALCRKLAWLGVVLDEDANHANGPRISAPQSAVSVWVIATNEELMIAQHTQALLLPGTASPETASPETGSPGTGSFHDSMVRLSG